MLEACNADMSCKNQDLAKRLRHASNDKNTREQKRRRRSEQDDSDESEAASSDEDEGGKEDGEGRSADLVAAKRRVRRLGKKFGMSCALFIPPGIDDLATLLRVDCSKITDFDPKDRFTEDPELLLLKLALDLELTIPDEQCLSRETEAKWFGDQVRALSLSSL
jgi:hypothetical protein